MPKTILITGAASGFGHDTALTLKAAGYDVYASMRDIAGRNKAAAAALEAQGVKTLELDVTSDASPEQAAAHVLKDAGKINVLINNAGIFGSGVSEAFTPTQAQQMFNTNVVGVIRMTRAVLPAMRAAKDGLIINLGSVVGRVTFPFFGIYGATKFALEGLTDSYRYELSQLGVEFVLLQPSAYPTNIFAAALQPADAARTASYGEIGEIPAKMSENFAAMFAAANAPDPHDVAAAIATLVATPKGSRPARLIVGQAFGADVLNDATAPVQQAAVEALGLGALAKLAV